MFVASTHDKMNGAGIIGYPGFMDKLAKQFGVDYAIRKDKTKDPPRYMVFFKAKDTEVLKQVVDEYAARSLQKGEKKITYN